MKYALWCVMAAMCVAVASAQDAAKTHEPVSVGKLIYAGDHKTECFNDAFLEVVDRGSRVHVARQLAEVKLHDVKLFAHPIVVMSGKGDFTLTDGEVEYLRAFLRHGGFLLASGKCQDAAFDAAFRKAMKRVLPDSPLTPLPADHALLKVMFDIKQVQTVRAFDKPLWIVEIDGRAAVLYSPVGLNDSAGMGTDCCCCGGNEIRNARWINANAVMYAMTR